MKSRFLASLAVLTQVISCQTQNPHDTNTERIDTARILASIDSLGAVVQKAHDTKDSNLLATTWAKNGALVIAGSPPVYGRDSIVTKLRNMPSLPEGGSIKMNIVEVQVINSQWAYVFGIDSLRYFSPSKKDTVNETSTFFVLVRKTSEGWQTYRETLSPNQRLCP